MENLPKKYANILFFVSVLIVILTFIPSSAVAADGDISGTVENEIGQSIDGATVTLNDDSSTITSTTDSSGFYEFKDISYGTYEITIEHPKYSSNNPETVVVSTTNSPVTRDFNPESDNPVIRKTGYVSGSILSSSASEDPIDSGPITGSNIEIVSHSEDDESGISGTSLEPEITASGSTYNITIPTGDVSVKVTQDGYSENISDVKSVGNNEVRDKDIKLTGRTTTVNGKIENTRGDPIQNANVTVETNYDIYPGLTEIEDVSDASGEYSFKVPESTTGVQRVIKSDADTFIENSIEREIPPVDSTDITLEHQGNSINGQIYDQNGNTLRGISVNVVGVDHSSVTTDSSGSFTVPSVPIGTHNIKFTHTDYDTRTINDVEVRIDGSTNMGSINLNRNSPVELSINEVVPSNIQPGDSVTIKYTHRENVNNNVNLKVSNGETTITNNTLTADNNGENTADISGTDVIDGTYSIEMTSLGKTVTDSIEVSGVVNPEKPDKIQEEEIRTPAGDFVNIETDGSYMIIGGDNEQGNTKQYFDILSVGGGTATLNTRLIGTNTTGIEADAYDGVTSYEQSIGADSEPKGEFSDIRFENENGNKIADTLAEFRNKIGIDSRKAPLQADRYRIVAGESGRIMLRDDGVPDFRKPVSRSNLVLTTNQEIGDIKTYVLPPGDIDEGVDNLIDKGVESNKFARGERVVVEVPAIGIWGSVLDSPDEELKKEDISKLLDRHEGVNIEFDTEEYGGPNHGSSELKFEDVSDSDIRVIKDGSSDLWDETEKLGDSPIIGGMYIVIDTRGSDPFTNQPEDGDVLEFKMEYQSPEGESYRFKDYSQESGELPNPFSPANDPTNNNIEHYPYFGDQQTTISSSTEIKFREPSISYDRKLQNGDLLVGTGSSDIIGSTTMAPGSRFTIQFIDKSPPNQELVKIKNVVVGDSRNFETTGDFSTINPGEEVRVELYSQDRITENRIVDTRDAKVVQNLENPARYNIDLQNKNVTVQQRYSLEDINATISNDGNLKGSKTAEIYIDDKLVYEENIILDPNEEKSIDLSNKFVTLPAGEYDFTVSTEFDESTGKLNVKIPEEGVIITENDTNQTTANSSIPSDTMPDNFNSTQKNGSNPQNQEKEENQDNIFGLIGIKSRDALIGSFITGSIYVLGEFV